MRPLMHRIADVKERSGGQHDHLARVEQQSLSLPLSLPPLQQNARGHGLKYKQGAKTEVALSANESKLTAGYFFATYTKLRAWGLTQYKAVLTLDNDVAVLTRLHSTQKNTFLRALDAVLAWDQRRQ